MKTQSLSSDILITLGDDEHPLRTSLKAATNISNRFGGFNGALQSLANSDLAAYQYIVRQGVPLKSIATEELSEAVYRAGTRNLMGDVMKYVSRLANGGRDPAETDEEDEDRDGGDEGEGALGNDGEV